MRNTIWNSITTIILITLLTGCKVKSETIQVGVEQSGQALSMKIGQTLEVRLPSNPST